MKKWAIAAFAYLLTVIGGYSVYVSLAVDGKREEMKQNHHELTSANNDINNYDCCHALI